MTQPTPIVETRPGLPRAITRLAAALGCAALLCAGVRPSVLPAEAQGVTPLPAHALALPRGAFPSTSVVHGKTIGNVAADRASGLHTHTFSALGRLNGYLQTATWYPAAKAHRHIYPFTLQYQASIFSSPDASAGAAGDARASLWEMGHALSPAHLQGSAFSVQERSYAQADVVLQHSVVEMELRLRYHTSAAKPDVNRALQSLVHAARTALSVAGGATQTAAPVTVQPNDLPPIYAAPWGTGPIAKSPSLMVVSGAQPDKTSLPDPGMFRFGAATLAARAIPTASLISSSNLARYTETGSALSGRGEWYDSAALYGGAEDARRAFDALLAANRGRRNLRPISGLVSSALPGVDQAQAWQIGGEMIMALRVRNVVMVLAGAPASQDDLAVVARRQIGTVPGWLHAQGTSIVDAAGNPVHLSALNWYGAEEQDFVVGGLDFRSYQSILETIRSLGYNCIRLPFSNQLVEQNPVVSAHVAANPELSGLHALDIMDRIIGYAGALGLSVILDDHRSDAGWSSQPSGLWYTAQYPDTSFDRDWATLATRYGVNDVVVGADLFNEPHAGATWGDGNQATDWLAAAERAGNTVLAANPNLLVIVEGIQHYANAPSAWWGANLMGVATAPVVLHFADSTSAQSRLVYSAHDYGPDNCGGGCPWFNDTTTYQNLAQMWDQYWGYIAADPTKPYSAPVWVGEFGTCNYQQSCVADAAPGSQGQWFTSLVHYLGERHLSWAYWSANGTQSTADTRVYGNLDWYGLLRQDWSGPVPWLNSALQGIQQDTAPGQTPPVSPP